MGPTMVKPLSILALAGLAVAQNNTAPNLVTALTGAASQLSTLAGLVPASLLQTLSSLQDITLLAPSNAAFAKDVRFTGGVIHIIDTVLSIPPLASDALTAGGLTSLRGALVAADLVDTVNGLDDVTIFAPSNEAFQSIGSALPNLTTEQVSSILTYHVVAGTVGYSSTLKNNTVLETVNGANLTITIDADGDVFVNDALVIMTDVLIANGVVHVIDEVLNPQNATINAPGDKKGDPAYQGATPVSAAPFTSGQPTASRTLAAGPTRAPNASTTSSGLPQATRNAAAKGAVGVCALFGAAAVYFL
ncbi:TGF beta induced ig-h3 precursor [Pyrenophora seminiperda CCB06]|uniref:TGF beta induced ig-h3 n=1 Tax=Pyrenophora seminiperda CCB06 TaxID=1302712 RepID=A0A3M7MAN1_9PLEO|nr:TGF beta induced ig-h3 precursor [Pyrenophora seminiperda CCB06]